MAFRGKYGPVARSIAEANEKSKPKNTKRAYQPRITEFKQFCESVYAEEANPFIVTEEKAYGFISYNAHRAKVENKNRKSTTDNSVQRFERADYDKVMNLIASFNHEEHNWDHFGDVLEFDSVNIYLCAVKTLMARQRDEGINSLQNWDLMTERMKLLLILVTERREKVSKALFKERATGDFEPFRMASELAKIEEFMWEYSCKTATFSASSMRDRFQYLMTLNGVLRMESMYIADLSDLCDFIFHQKDELDPYQCLIMRIGTGKANKSRVIFGRAMRHTDPRLCAMGGLAFYLHIRFLVTKEYEEFDFCDNSTWFNRKLIRSMPKKKPKTKRKRTEAEQKALDQLEEVLGEFTTTFCIYKYI